MGCGVPAAAHVDRLGVVLDLAFKMTTIMIFMHVAQRRGVKLVNGHRSQAPAQETLHWHFSIASSAIAFVRKVRGHSSPSPIPYFSLY
jgi:hypothetical protein